MKKIKKNNLNVYDYEGTGKPLVFIHAFPLCSRMWDKQIEFFKDKFRVITYDLRALGDSTKDDLQYTMETLVNDFLEIIDKLKLQKVNVCGLSIGGYITLRAIVKRREIFNSVMLADTKAEKDSDDALLNRSNAIINIKKGNRKEFSDSMLKNLICKKSYDNPHIRNFVEEIINLQSDEGICSTLIALATRTNVSDYLNHLNIPSLIIVGSEDVLVPKESAEKMKKCFENPDLKIIQNAGHLSNLENPDEFNNAISDFLYVNIKE